VPARAPTPSRLDYAALAQFRFELRRFLAFSERVSDAVGLEPHGRELLQAVAPPPLGAVVDLRQPGAKLADLHVDVREAPLPIRREGLGVELGKLGPVVFDGSAAHVVAHLRVDRRYRRDPLEQGAQIKARAADQDRQSAGRMDVGEFGTMAVVTDPGGAAIGNSFRPTACRSRRSKTQSSHPGQNQIHSPARSSLEETLEADISIWQGTGHSYFALTPAAGRRNLPNLTAR